MAIVGEKRGDIYERPSREDRLESRAAQTTAPAPTLPEPEAAPPAAGAPPPQAQEPEPPVSAPVPAGPPAEAPVGAPAPVAQQPAAVLPSFVRPGTFGAAPFRGVQYSEPFQAGRKSAGDLLPLFAAPPGLGGIASLADGDADQRRNRIEDETRFIGTLNQLRNRRG
jgi:hypothetical protein